MDFNSFKAKAKVLDLASMRGIVGGSGTCAFITRDGFVFAGVSKSEAMSYASGGGRWCCDSCHKASWLQ